MSPRNATLVVLASCLMLLPGVTAGETDAKPSECGGQDEPPCETEPQGTCRTMSIHDSDTPLGMVSVDPDGCYREWLAKNVIPRGATQQDEESGDGE